MWPKQRLAELHKKCKHPPTNTRPQSHLFHDKTTCNLTGGVREPSRMAAYWTGGGGSVCASSMREYATLCTLRAHAVLLESAVPRPLIYILL